METPTKVKLRKSISSLQIRTNPDPKDHKRSPSNSNGMVIEVLSAGFESGNIAKITINNEPVDCGKNENGHW